MGGREENGKRGFSGKGGKYQCLVVSSEQVGKVKVTGTWLCLPWNKLPLVSWEKQQNWGGSEIVIVPV